VVFYLFRYYRLYIIDYKGVMDPILLIVTIIEAVYLLFMYCVFKTEYSFSGATYEKAVQSWGKAFVHDTGVYENKVCMFGKFMAYIFAGWWILRYFIIINYPAYKWPLLYGTVGFDMVGLILAYMMNLNAFVYLGPLIFAELYVISKIVGIDLQAVTRQD